MSFISLNKLKSYIPFTASDTTNDNQSKRNSTNKSNRIYDKLDPEVGFKLTLDGDGTPTENSTAPVPELIVNVIGARHLPSLFGLKTVQGFIIKVKLFPGSVRYDTTIQTSTWPSFNEYFRFQLAPTHKSSFKTKTREDLSRKTLPEKLFKGHFVVLTVFALLDIPNEAIPFMKSKLLSKLSKRRSSAASENGKDSNDNEPNDSNRKDFMHLTTSEMRRNIGSVTCFLDPKIFEQNPRNKLYVTEEIWLPIKDITVTTSSVKLPISVATSPKGQIEIILELCDPEMNKAEQNTDTVSNDDNQISTNGSSEKDSSNKTKWNLKDVKKKITKNKHDNITGLCLKISTTKMRCSIKVKEEFENVGAPIYIKTTVFEHNILSGSWKSDPFYPSLSTRWNPDDSLMIVSLPNDDSLNFISLQTTIAMKTKMGKKIVLGSVIIGSHAGSELGQSHWMDMINSRGKPVPMWHSFQ